MKDTDPLDSLIDKAFARLEEVDSDLSRLGEPDRTIVIVVSAQGRIDNGGLRCFFEDDFPGNPSYSVIARAYARIGCAGVASAINRSADSFGVVDPENQVHQRRAFMQAHWDEESQTVRGWDDSACGDPEVWSKLERWALANAGDGFD